MVGERSGGDEGGEGRGRIEREKWIGGRGKREGMRERERGKRKGWRGGDEGILFQGKLFKHTHCTEMTHHNKRHRWTKFKSELRTKMQVALKINLPTSSMTNATNKGLIFTHTKIKAYTQHIRLSGEMDLM